MLIHVSMYLSVLILNNLAVSSISSLEMCLIKIAHFDRLNKIINKTKYLISDILY